MNDEIIKRLGYYMVKNGMKFKDVAEKSGLSRSTLSRICNKGRRISVENYFAICEALDADPVWLWYGERNICCEINKGIDDLLKNTCKDD